MTFEKNPEEKLYQMICDHYDSKKITYQRDDDCKLTLMVNRDREIPVNLFVSAEADPLSLRICGQLPFTVPEEQRNMVVLALQAINQRLTMGRFQMNVSDGIVNYRASLPLVGLMFDEEWLDNVLDDAIFYITSRDEKLLALLRGEMSFAEFEQKVR